MAEEKKEKPISYLMMGALLTCAIVIDLLQAMMDFASEPLFIALFFAAGGTAGAIAGAVVSLGLLTGVGAAAGAAAGAALGLIFGFIFAAIFNLFLDVIAVCVFGFWFHLLSEASEQKIEFGGKLAIGMFIEMIPFANMLPAWTATVGWTILIANGGSLLGAAQTALNFIPIGRVANVGLKAVAASGVEKVAAQGVASRGVGAAISSRGGLGATAQGLSRQASTIPYRPQIDGLQKRPARDTDQNNDPERTTVPQTA